jgi:ABC-type sugar transport system permease subunit
MEGATAWEYFWKIVFPSVSPFILANLIFTVIDSFTNPMNSVMNRIVAMKNQWEFGGASAMAWVYFAIVLGAIGVFAWLTGKFIQYETD